MKHPSKPIRSRKQEKPELLAPAGRIETFCAALDAGADAVYAGAHAFNARMRAPNFTIDELTRMADYAHRSGKKLYLTVNTIVKDTELNALKQLLRDMRAIHPDALIVQDIGTARLAQRICPDIPLHASTQMTIHNVDGALAAQKMGFARVILARECTIEEIREIRCSCEIELETFVHGAMCYSMSGQCFASGLIHGKSANRGRCLQPCRRLFQGIPENAGNRSESNKEETTDPSSPLSDENRCFPAYSMRDLCAAPILERLIASGISCFKIEGRMKPPEQVAQIVRAYRLLIDAWPKITAEVMEESRQLLETAVGREPHTGYYLSSTPPVLGAKETQSGRPVGRSESADTPGFFRISPRVPLKVGDRLRVQLNPNSPPQGFTIRQILYQGRSTKRPPVGATIEVAAPFNIPPGRWIVKASDADAIPRGFAHRIQSMMDEIFQGPSDSPSAPPGSVENTVPISDDLPSSSQREPRSAEGQPCRWIFLSSADQALQLAEHTAFQSKYNNRENRICVPVESVQEEAFTRLIRATEHGGRLGLIFPQFYFGLHAREYLYETLKRGLAMGVRNLVISHPAHFQVVRSLGKRRITLLAGAGFHLMNRESINHVLGEGARVVQVSLECDRENWQSLVMHFPVGTLAITV